MGELKRERGMRTGIRGPKTFRARVFWSFIPIILVLFGLVAVFTVQRQTRLIEEEFLKRGREMATSLAHASELGALAEDEQLLEFPLRGVASQADVSYVLIYSEAGEVVARGGAQVEAATLDLSGSEGERLCESREVITRDVTAGGKQWKEFIAPIVSEAVSTPDEELLGTLVERRKGVVGLVRIGFSLDALKANVVALVRLWSRLQLCFSRRQPW